LTIRNKTARGAVEPRAAVYSEPQNIEYRTAEYRRVVSLRSVFFIKKIEYITSIFDIRYSLFDIRFFRFFFDQAGCCFGRRRR